jgi:hypothetical protein
MIGNTVFAPALQAARAQSIDRRIDAARAGPQGILNQFQTESRCVLANRWADGLTAIDTAVAALDAAWVNNAGASSPGGNANDTLVTAVLNASTTWIAARRFGRSAGYGITGWRVKPIQDLYWRVAWCFARDHFRQRAATQIGANNLNNVATSLREPVAATSNVGNPYDFAGAGTSTARSTNHLGSCAAIRAGP